MIIYYKRGFRGGREESRRLLASAIAEYTGDASAAAGLAESIKTGEMGKPYIEGFSHFSVSHTGDVWAVLFSDIECGLDIQNDRDCKISSIAKRIFAPSDAELVTGMAETDPDAARSEFFRLWSRREALVKAFGGSVYETDLPPVSGPYAIIGGREYAIKDLSFPCMPDMHAAAAFCGKTGQIDEIREIR